MKIHDFSRTLQQCDHPDVTVVADKVEETVARLREQPERDILLFGGGSLFRSLAEAKLVDRFEVAVILILLGGGVPLSPPPARRNPLAFQKKTVYPSGIVVLEYAIE